MTYNRELHDLKGAESLVDRLTADLEAGGKLLHVQALALLQRYEDAQESNNLAAASLRHIAATTPLL